MSTKRTSKKSTTKRRGRPPKSETVKRRESAQASSKRQLAALILFGVSLILGVLTFLEGENFWAILHKGFFGLFGVSAYLIAPLCLLISLFLAFEERVGSIKNKIIQALLLVLLVSGALHIFFAVEPEGDHFFSKLINLFELGVQRKGGGLTAAIFGWSLSALFGKVAASIVIVIVIVIFLFIIFGITVSDIVKFFKSSVKKPVESIEKAYQEHLEQRETEDEQPDEDEYSPDIDISLGPDAKKRRGRSPSTLTEEINDPKTKEEKAERAKRKLLGESDIDIEIDEDEAQAPAEDEPVQIKIDDLFDTPDDDKKEEKAESKEEEKLEQTSLYNTGAENRVYTFPPLTLLNAPKITRQSDSEGEIQQNAEILMDTLSSFGVKTRLLGAVRGPAVTRYELQPSAGVRISKITQLSNDIALNLAATKVRIEAPIPNKAAVGIEVPNSVVSGVTLREILSSSNFKASKNDLEVALGKDIAGNIITTDLSKMPHLLIAGTTGSGKSVCTNSMIVSLLYKSSPADVRLILIDPKMVEFNIYNGIPHLLIPVVTDPRKAAGALGWAVSEMENRYNLFAEHGVKEITSYNDKAQNSDNMTPMPKIVIVIDEFADLMMTAPGDVETAVCRLAQKARAAGIHLVIATQRPSVNVITGLIKANITSRIALTVSSQIDSRTIIDTGGAEALLGRGDMLFKPYGSDRMLRVQGCFVSEKEIHDVVSYIKSNECAEYDQQVIDEIEKQAVKEKDKASRDFDDGEDDDRVDPMLTAAIECVIENGKASTSLLQRKLKVGYARAASLIDEMEERGIVSGYMGSKPREVLISHDQWVEMTMKESE